MIREGELDGLLGEDPLSVELAAAQPRADEATVVASGPVGAVSARVPLGLGGKIQVGRDEPAIGRTAAKGQQPRALIRARREARVDHPEWSIDVPGEVVGEGLTRDPLDDEAEPVRAHPVLPHRPGVVHQGRVQRLPAPLQRARQTALLDVAKEALVGEEVAEPRGVG